jgi:hypothetical protein
MMPKAQATRGNNVSFFKDTIKKVKMGENTGKSSIC